MTHDVTRPPSRGQYVLRRKPSRKPRPVVDPNGTVFATMSDAARAHRIWPSAVQMRAECEKGGWRLANEAEIAALAALSER